MCARLLGEHAQLFGRTERYTIYDRGDMRRVVDWILSAKEHPEVQEAVSRCGQPAAPEFQSSIAGAKHASRVKQIKRRNSGPMMCYK